MLSRSTLAALAALAVLACGCFPSHSSRITGPAAGTTPIVPNTPTQAVRALEAAWNQRSVPGVRDLLAGDFGFQFGLSDSAGSAYRSGLDRDAMIEAVTNLFARGTACAAPADRIKLSFDPTLLALPDSRPGHHARWHKMIATQVVMRVQAEDFEYEIQGVARFFLVRGDSMIVPALWEGPHPDSTTWWIDRQEDESVDSTALETPLPTRSHSWGELLVWYLRCP